MSDQKLPHSKKLYTTVTGAESLSAPTGLPLHFAGRKVRSITEMSRRISFNGDFRMLTIPLIELAIKHPRRRNLVGAGFSVVGK